jgi:hypothetical protein
LNRHLIFTLLAPAVAILVSPMYAQDSGAANVYKDQFVQLHARTKEILHKAEELGKGDSTDRAILNLEEETLALNKLVNQLGAESLRSNLDGLKKGQPPNKTLLLVASGCEEIAFVLQVLDNFLDTKDRVFLGFAKHGDDITSALQEIL